jgi:hypothetical protein
MLQQQLQNAGVIAARGLVQRDRLAHVDIQICVRQKHH